MRSERSQTRRGLRLAAQVAGFLCGLALLGWCVTLALRPENREKIERLGEAPPSLMLSLLALGAGSLVANGLAFGAVIRPVRPVPVLSVLAANAIATFLNNFPFKLGMVARALIHNRRDRVPLMTIGAWFAAMAAIMTLAVGSLLVATLVRGRVDAGWLVLLAVLLLMGGVAGMSTARHLAGERGLARIGSLAGRWWIVGRFVRSRLFADLHAGFAMLASPAAMAWGTALRLLDVGLYAARFAVAAAIVGVPLSAAEAITYGVAYFAIGVLSPVGMLGLREAGATGLAGAMALYAGGATEVSAGMQVIPLLVGGAEVIVNLAGAGVGIAVLRPDRLLRMGRPAPDPPPATDAPPA